MWSYDPALPTDKDQIRFLIGDTDSTSKQIEDEAITVFMTQAGDNLYLAASRIARLLSTRFARMNSVWVDSVRIDYAAKAKAYLDLSMELAGIGGSSGLGAPFVGGVSISEMSGVASDTDRPPSSFTIGMGDDDGAVPVELQIE